MRQNVVVRIASASVIASLYTACFSPPPPAGSTDASTSATVDETTSPTATSAPATTDSTAATATTDAETSLPPTTSTASTGAPDTDTTEPPQTTTSSESTTSETTAPDTTTDNNTCGNGLIERGELCDDGNQSDNDECIATCVPAICGDGILQNGVEECDDANDIDSDDCVPDCKSATCGDSFIHATAEECDDGNTVEGDGCASTCNFEVCGNGLIHGDEACDDGNLVNGDGCSATCERDAAFVFVSNDKFTGAQMMDALAYATNQCDSEAANLEDAMDGVQNLSPFLPWMSNSMTSPANGFVKSARPYVLPGGGPVVANNWADLIDGSLDHPINVTSTLLTLDLAGSECGSDVITWTGTGLQGQSLAATCNNWSSLVVVGNIGSARSADTDWTTCSDDHGCINPARVFCFEQLPP
jgi:cysteine-rich repeat protein